MVLVSSDSFDTEAEQAGMVCVIIFIGNDVIIRICVNKDIKHFTFCIMFGNLYEFLSTNFIYCCSYSCEMNTTVSPFSSSGN